MLPVLLVAVGAAMAAMMGGLFAVWRKPTTFVSSLVLGFAAGVMVATVTFEIIPQALRLGALAVVAAGFAAGFVAVYAFDLFVHRGHTAGERAEQHERVEDIHRRHPPRGDEATVLASGTVFESVVEGVSLAVSASLGAGLSLPLAVAIAIDNLSEGLGIGAIGTAGQDRPPLRRLVRLTGLIGAATVGAAASGWLLMRGLSPSIHAFVLAAGGGGMLFLTVTELVPDAEAQQYQQSSAIAVAVGFLAVLILSELA